MKTAEIAKLLCLAECGNTCVKESLIRKIALQENLDTGFNSLYQIRRGYMADQDIWNFRRH